MRSTTSIFKTATLHSVSILALATAATFATTNVKAKETQLPGVTIYTTTPQVLSEGGSGEEGQLPANSVEDPDSPARPPSFGDAGEFLRHVTGVDAGRKGGHGLEPNIRGLDQNQLGITNDGAFQFGGCPNRMDPPTSHMQLYTFDKVTVKRGYQSVADGPPAPGGSIQFERENPTFEPGSEISKNLKAGIGYNYQAGAKEAFADGSMGNDWGYIRAFTSAATQNNYEDGDGNTVRSGFDQYGGGLILGRTFDADSWVSLKIENNNVDDALFPGSGMDAPITDDWTYQAKMATDLNWGAITGVEGDMYVTTVDHTMNNFDIRDRPAPQPFMEARMESDTYGGKAIFNGEVNDVTFKFGGDYRDVVRDGNRYSGPNGNYDPSTLQSVLWPDTSIKNLGVFGEANFPLSTDTNMIVGLRYDRVDASADEANQVATATGQSANNLYTRFYGKTAEDKTEHNFGGMVRLEQKLGSDLSLFGTASRSVRTADATERYMASFSGAGGVNSWVGNPDIDPEKHHQIDIGMSYDTKSLNMSGSVYYNYVQDFIQLDSARGQDGILENTSTASVYTNINAILAGFEADVTYHFAENWKVNLGANYTYGENLRDDIALAQIAPLSGRVELSYDNKDWMTGVRVNAATAQNRVDDNRTTGSGQDSSGDTDGYVTLDLFGAYNINESIQLTGGVTNLFDATYANHLNAKNLSDPTGIRVNEPGRSFYVRAVAKF